MYWKQTNKQKKANKENKLFETVTEKVNDSSHCEDNS